MRLPHFKKFTRLTDWILEAIILFVLQLFWAVPLIVFTDKFNEAFFWGCYILTCVVSVGIQIALRIKEKSN